ncbi:uncharacterized protein LY89DRAFT_70153 [Mollisia scopiformis]|uniref:Uncharacterized protein n=1 Tax=Mollisia scopiformis TaxID=149040 RepID=A0A194XA28_MOLSC|nr:uncharacterized protein LY89DRAFT_70153 [Mollisia scopiformis]KUJ17026.1 hypothetical protein LY89DRAFT_70153 [Mollisia scopiformis]
MRGLLGAFLLAPALAAALVVPDVQIEDWEGAISSRPVAAHDRAVAYLGVVVPQASDVQSPDEDRLLQFKLEVLSSEQACGFGNVTLDGQVLPQTLDGNFPSGTGPISTAQQNIVTGSWSFHCIKINGLPDSQLMKFTVDAIDGEIVQDVGFSILFRQAGQVSIMNIETDLSIPDDVVANPNPEGLRPVKEMDEPYFDVEEEVAELEYLWSQLREIKYLIHEKEKALAHHGNRQHVSDLKDCDSLKCVVKAFAQHAKNAAHDLYGKVRGEFDEEEDEFGHPHFKHPKFPKFKNPFKGGKNHTCGPPKHGKGNHTLPHPPWKKPHHRPLPVCRYPHPRFHHGPPPFHYGPPPFGRPHGMLHGGPGAHHGPEDRPHPHHFMPTPNDFEWPSPKHHWNHPPPPPEDAPDMPLPDFDGPQPHHHEESPEFDGPHHHQGPPDFDAPPPSHHEGRPGREGPHHHENPPDFEGLSRHHGGPPDFDGPPPHHEERPDFEAPPDFDGPPPPHHGNHPPPPPPPEFEHEGGHMGPPGPPHRNGLVKALIITKFTAIGFLFAFLIIALHRRLCTPKRRADRQARREERHRRRAYRRAAHKHLITRLLARLSGEETDSDDEDYEEKRERLLADAEDGMSTTMTEDIREMRTTADVAGEMVIADSQPAIVPETQPLMADDLTSQIGEGEELPAYEDNDGSEMSSVIADGFRYTPGGMGREEYTPSQSDAGSVSDILGPDTKS